MRNKVQVGNLIAYKPLVDGLDAGKYHTVLVVETNLRDIVCQDVFGNEFDLSYDRVVMVQNDDKRLKLFATLQEAYK